MSLVDQMKCYQPFADARGFGEAWRRVYEERTPRSAWEARCAALDAGAPWAASAAGAAGVANVSSPENLQHWTGIALGYLSHALGEEAKRDALWEAVERFQYRADEFGFGDAWRKALSDRTLEAVIAAWEEAATWDAEASVAIARLVAFGSPIAKAEGTR